MQERSSSSDGEERPPEPSGIAELHRALVDGLVASGAVRDERMEAAFRAVPRHLFLPELPPEQVYVDEAVVTRWEERMPVSSSSQPSMMAIMLTQLDLREGHKVLEIGTATGYNAAIIDHIVGPSGSVTTIDIDEELVTSAREHLAAAGHGRVTALAADGGFGYREGAPYDRIIVTVGSSDLLPAWIDQLAPEGILVLPLVVTSDLQWSAALVRDGDRLVSRSVRSCRFVRLRGEFALQNERRVELADEPGLILSLDSGESTPAPPEEIVRLLSGPGRDFPAGIDVGEREIMLRLAPWLTMQGLEPFGIQATQGWADRGVVPYLLGVAGRGVFSIGVMRNGTIAIFMRPPDATPPAEQGDTREEFPLWIRSHGKDPSVATWLRSLVERWDTVGRPASDDGIRLVIHPGRSAAEVAAAEGTSSHDGRPGGGRNLTVERRWSTIVVEHTS